MKFEYKEYNKKASKDDLISDIKGVNEELKKSSLSIAEYDDYGLYSSSTIIRKFGSWNQALELAGLGHRNRFFTTEELFENIEKVWIAKRKQPVRRDMDEKNLSYISSGAYLRKFGKWSTALKEFINYINQDTTNLVDDTLLHKKDAHHHKTKRDVNLSLRFKVMQRDSFKCSICGTSPAVDSSVALHIDHIKPYSKGGETIIDNLQTLCSRCNWGKGNIE